MDTNDVLENYVRCKVLYEMAHSLHDRICHDESASKEVSETFGQKWGLKGENS